MTFTSLHYSCFGCITKALSCGASAFPLFAQPCQSHVVLRSPCMSVFYSPNARSTESGAMDAWGPFSEYEAVTQNGGDASSSSPMSISYASSGQSNASEEYECDYFRKAVESSVERRDLRVAMRRLSDVITELDQMGDIFEGKRHLPWADRERGSGDGPAVRLRPSLMRMSAGNCRPRNLTAWAQMQAIYETRIRSACAKVIALTPNVAMLGKTLEQFDQKWHEAELNGADKKEGVDALLRALRIEIEDRVSDMDENFGPDSEALSQEASWAERFFLRSQATG